MIWPIFRLALILHSENKSMMRFTISNQLRVIVKWYRLVHDIRNPNEGKFSGAQQPCKHHGIASVVLQPIARSDRVWLGATTRQTNPNASICRKTLYPHGPAS